MAEPIRLFVGTDVYQRAAGAERVIENSLKRNTKGEVDIVWMRQGSPGWDWGGQAYSWCTPFSMFRWFIPEYCNWEGRAIYIDADMAILRDLEELWTHPLPSGAPGAFAGRMSSKADVILWQCDQVPKWKREPDEVSDIGIYEGRQARVRKMGAEALYKRYLPQYWDCRDVVKHEGPERTGILHWTKLATQPYHPYKHAYPYDIPHACPEACAVFWDYLGMSEEEWAVHPDRIPVETAPA